MNAFPSEETMSENDLLSELVGLINSGDLIAELRPDGQVGWRPAPLPADTDVRICALCGGSGFLSPAIAGLVSADFRLENMCPECHGTGIADAANEAAPTEPLSANDRIWLHLAAEEPAIADLLFGEQRDNDEVPL